MSRTEWRRGPRSKHSFDLEYTPDHWHEWLVRYMRTPPGEKTDTKWIIVLKESAKGPLYLDGGSFPDSLYRDHAYRFDCQEDAEQFIRECKVQHLRLEEIESA